jgi:CubicO group peptidase (beta-lactamase class C family)
MMDHADIAALLADQMDVRRKSVGMTIGIVSAKGRRVISHGVVERGGTAPVDSRTPFELASISKVFTAGGFMSTADDMLTLAAALLELTSSPLAGLLDVMTATRRPIRPSLVRILRDNWRTALRMIFSPPEGMRSAVRYFSGAEAGLAWFIFKKGRREMIVHDGGAPGSQGSLAIDRQARTAVVVLSNTGINIHDVARHVLWPDYPLSRARTEVNVATSALDRYIGTYQVAKGPAFGITRGNGRLTLTFPVWGPLVLRAENDHDFFLPELDCEIRFAAGGVIREMVMQPGRGWPSFPIPKVGQ